ncbi:alkaline phosphatase [Anaerocolumna xylanovorans]|uniref:Alkaline phosphatase n=1 Tax=Anaerocolumna xylanovorans DSM 12503 TaxID=1121345 RepID=A0A1M7Y2F8_9FIRM|nr:alkaline phosphatase [Anaerocolumna xylanovorans]SHO46125.1 alkaline phosphatase [Anaerocolumna xylanovorans DSM 12503]
MINKTFKRAIACIIAGIFLLTFMFTNDFTSVKSNASGSQKETQAVSLKAPKYVFMFIGDGMSFPQIQAASDYLGAISQDKSSKVLTGNKYLDFTKFPVAGSAVTYDSTSFCPDSASTATSLSTGHKTYSGTINMDETMTISYETISEKLKKQLGYKIGIISTVNLNHATPAAYYAHQASRNNYYAIGLEMIHSGFDYFAGGALINPDGDKKDTPQTNLYKLAKDSGYKVLTAQKDAEALTAADGKSIVIGETLADSNSLSYSNDTKTGEWALKDYVKKGIDVLYNKKGFFMMVEGGKIDWACHANDAGSTISDTLALDDAVKEAINFYKKYPSETLIIVTGDHETGGLTIGYAGTEYSTFLDNLSNQKLSYAKFDSAYVKKYKENKTSFTDVLTDIKKNFGLITDTDPSSAAYPNLVLTPYEYNKLKAAYDMTITGKAAKSQEEYLLYGSYEPLTVTITHILNNKSGIAFTSYSHTGLPVGVFAQGQGADLFGGYYDNTQIYFNLASLLKVK